MTITHRSWGTADAGTGSSTPGYPAGMQSGDRYLLFGMCKPSTANVYGIGAAVADHIVNDGLTTASSNGAGSVEVSLWSKIVYTSESGTLSCTATNAAPHFLQFAAFYESDGNRTWDTTDLWWGLQDADVAGTTVSANVANTGLVGSSALVTEDYTTQAGTWVEIPFGDANAVWQEINRDQWMIFQGYNGFYKRTSDSDGVVLVEIDTASDGSGSQMGQDSWTPNFSTIDGQYLARAINAKLDANTTYYWRMYRLGATTGQVWLNCPGDVAPGASSRGASGDLGVRWQYYNLPELKSGDVLFCVMATNNDTNTLSSISLSVPGVTLSTGTPTVWTTTTSNDGTLYNYWRPVSTGGKITGQPVLTAVAAETGKAALGCIVYVLRTNSSTQNATFSATTVGNAAASGASGSMYAAADATFSATTVGNASASGASTTMTGTQDGSMSTAVGNAAAAGVSGSFTGAGTFAATTVGDAAAAGASGSMTGQSNATFSATTPGDVSVSGASGSLTAESVFGTTVGNAAASGAATTMRADVTFSSLVGDAGASGGVGSMAATTNATFSSTVGDAQASGTSASLTGGATFSATTAGNADGSGAQGSMTGEQNATFSTSVGNAAASGGEGILTAATLFVGTVGNATAAGSPATLTGAATFAATTVGNTAASGASTTMSGVSVFATDTGNATASGASGSMTGVSNATFSATTPGDASASGAVGYLVGSASGHFGTVVGNASASGGVAYLRTDGTMETVGGQADASGNVASLVGSGMFLTTDAGIVVGSGASGRLVGGVSIPMFMGTVQVASLRVGETQSERGYVGTELRYGTAP